jgi:hypothetical protein
MPLAVQAGMVYMVSRFGCWRSLALVLSFLLLAGRADAGSLAFAWDPSPEPEIAGYTLAYGTQSGKYTGWIDVGNATAYTVTLPDGTYYVAVRAYTHDGTISGYSNEVVATIITAVAPPPKTSPTPAPAPATSSCTTSDPFASMGGGTCYLGGWLPPGMPVPGGSTTPAPAPAPAPAPSAPVSSVGCTTADPFAGMGGGTCYNGGWLPPGMPIPGGGISAPAPAPAPAPSPSPTPVPAPSWPQTCSTADPFAGLGGGTCYNGGWLPPGMAIPGGGTSTPAPAPAPTPTPAPQPSAPVEHPGCPSADPFASMGGGTCYQGGWLPPGMSITVTGTLSVLSLQDELWVIRGDDGTIYTSPTDVSPLLLIDGATVTFHGLTLPSTSSTDDVVVIEILAFEVHQ